MNKKHETYTLDRYVKWFASLFLITGMILRTTQQYMFVDITLSMIGAAGWMWVGIIWKDRSLTLLNATATSFLLYGFIIGLTKLHK